MSSDSLHSPFFRRFSLHPQPCLYVDWIEVLDVVETGVSHDEVDVRFVVHLICEGEEMFGVQEYLVSERFEGVACSLTFFTAGIQGGRCRNNLD